MSLNYGRIFQVCLMGAALSACSSSSSDSDVKTSDVGIRFSDAPVESIESVVITVDKLIFNRAGEDIVVDTFTNGIELDDSETFQLDLLDYQGLASRLVLDAVKLPVGDYQNLRIVVLQDNEDTYVQETENGPHKELKVPSGELKLGGFTVSETSSQTFVVEFGLRQAMTYNPGPDRYILKPRGVRIVRLEDAASISGTVDLSTESCTTTEDANLSHVAYLYEGHDLNATLLGDVFVRASDIIVSEGGDSADNDFDENVDDNIIAPFVATSIDADTGKYVFSYLDSGNYTVAIACNAVVDDAIIYNKITIPTPAGQLVELTLEQEVNITCDFTEGFDTVDACTVNTPQ